MASFAAVPPGFHYETKHVVLSYLGLLSEGTLRGHPPSAPQGVQQDVASQPLGHEVVLKVKTEIEEELRSLDKEISEAFSSTGFDRLASPVFSPANPESSVEDCLAHLGEKLSQELGEPLHAAVQTLLSQPMTYQVYRERALETAARARGWNKVLVPLVLLRQMLLALMRRGAGPWSTLLQFGVTFLEEHTAEFIIQQGGWGAVFALESEEEEEEEEPGAAADDSNDIYILPSDNSGQVSPPESPTVVAPWQAESLPVSLSASQSWHTESLPVSLGPESWQQIAVDPEELKSLDSNGAGENNSSNSDIVHVEREEIPEGAEGAPGPLLTHLPAPSSPGTRGPGRTATSLPVELGEEEVRAAAAPVGSEQEVPALEPPEARPSLEPVRIGKGNLPEGPWSTGEGRAAPAAEGKSVLLLGGAAAAALLAVAVGVALALRRK